MSGDPFFQDFHLATPDPGEDITHPVIETNPGMLKMKCILPGLGRKKPGLFNIFLTGGNQRSPGRCGNDFVPVE